MATDPRQGFDPTDLITDVSARFEALAAMFQAQIEDLEAQPAPDLQELVHLQRALKAARRGAARSERAN